MDWGAAVDAYCERLGPGFWAEPLNAVTNAAFLVAAVLAWRGARGVPVARGLAVVLGLIGVGSFLFHTLATRWAGLADVAPIAVFILGYVWAANRHMLGLSPWAAGLATAAYLPAHAALAAMMAGLPVVGVSAAYLPVPVAILGYAGLIAARHPRTARGLAIGAGVLGLSIAARSLDQPFCAAVPRGTHFLWHLANALMLWWMIGVLVRHVRGLRTGAAWPSMTDRGDMP